MSLYLLVVIVVAGISAVVAAVHFTGGSRLASLADEDAARRRFAVDHPELVVRRVWLADAGRSAILEVDDGRVGIVHGLGSKFLTRLVDKTNLAGAPRASGRRLALRLRDFAWPGGIFDFGDEAIAARVEALFAQQRSDGMWSEG